MSGNRGARLVTPPGKRYRQDRQNAQLRRPISSFAAFWLGLRDSTRTVFTGVDEIAGVWCFRFKAQAGDTWMRMDPWWNCSGVSPTVLVACYCARVCTMRGLEDQQSARIGGTSNPGSKTRHESFHSSLHRVAVQEALGGRPV